MAESPDGKGVLLFGGQVDGNAQEDKRQNILKLTDIHNSWNILDITLQERRELHVVIPLL